jgi:hypothetical protein
VGLITGLLTLPLAPVRGTIWLAQVIQEEVERRQDDEPAIMAALEELETARATGEFDEEEIERAENELIEQLIALRGAGGQESNGGF